MYHFRPKARFVLTVIAVSLSACTPATAPLGQASPQPVPSFSPSVQASEAPSSAPSPSATATLAAPSPDASPSGSVSPGSPSVPPSVPGASASPVPTAPLAAPARPGGLSIVERTDSTLTLQWDFGGEPVSYRLYLDGKPVAENHSTPNYYRFENLSAATSYRVGVQVVTAAGAISEIVTLNGATMTSGRSGSGNFSGGGSSSGGSSGSGSLIYVPDGDEFRANTFVTGGQYEPEIGMAADGSFVISWYGYMQDGSDASIYAQRFTSDGEPVSTEFRVNTFTAGGQADHDLAMNSEGEFVVVWSSVDQDGDGVGVYGQRFDRDGNPSGDEFPVNTYTTSQQHFSAVAMNDSGEFVVSWHSQDQDGSGMGIYGQRFDRDGDKVGTEFAINTTTSSNQTYPEVAMDADGDFVVVWSSADQDGSGYGVYGQRFDEDGNRKGDEFRINTTTSSNQTYPDLAMDADGDFAVVWTSSGQDGSNDGIYGQRFNARGSALGSEFRVNSYTTDEQMDSALAMNADGEFVVTWQSRNQDTSGIGVYAQRYSAAGEALGVEFQAPLYHTGDQNYPDVAMGSDGRFVVAWTDEANRDGDSAGIYGLRYKGIAEPDELVAFSDIAPILDQRCSGCHGFVSSYPRVRSKSTLVREYVYETEFMPEEGSEEARDMTNAERQLIADWVDHGMLP